MRRAAKIMIRLGLAALGLALVSACARDDEAAMRARMDQWFALGETLTFQAGPDCAAAAFRLVDMRIGSAMPVVASADAFSRTLPRRGLAALDNPDQAPDAAMVALANSDRPLGMGMRRAALEARSCMADMAESAFRYALANPNSILAWEAGSATLMLADPHTGVLVVAMGAG